MGRPSRSTLLVKRSSAGSPRSPRSPRSFRGSRSRRTSCWVAEPSAASIIRRRSLQEDYRRVATTAGFELSGELPAGQLRIAEQQQVEILRALSRDAQVIIMDEPSAALNGPESAKLHRVIRSLAAGGKTILLISHFLREVLDLADTITVLRDGRIVANTVASGATEQTLVEADARPPARRRRFQPSSCPTRTPPSCSASRTSTPRASSTRRWKFGRERSSALPVSSEPAGANLREPSSARHDRVPARSARRISGSDAVPSTA